MRKNIIPLVFVVLFLAGCGKVTTKTTLEEAFPLFFDSEHFETQITSIILTGEFKETGLVMELKKRLEDSRDIERTAILYVLAKANPLYNEQFIDSIPCDKEGSEKLLKVESPAKSYFRPPFFRIINYLKELMCKNDKAFKKAVIINNYTSGWQKEILSRYIEETEQCRKLNEDKA